MKNLEKLAELATKLPDEVRANAQALVQRMGEVIEGFGDKPMEWRPEIMKVVQGTSDRSKLPKGAAIGSMIAGEDILPSPYPVIPLRIVETRQMWDPDPEKAKLVCSSPDGVTGYRYGDCKSCDYGKFDVEANKSACNKVLQVMNVSGDLSRVIIANFSKTNYINGSEWRSLMKKAAVAPFKRKYNLLTETSAKSKNVEILRAEPYGKTAEDRQVSGPVLDFVQELFDLSGQDRKEFIENYYIAIKARQDQQAQALAAPAPGGEVTLIVDDTPDVEIAHVAHSEKTEKTKAKYNL